MALSNVLTLSQLAGHVIIVILALCMIVPMILNLEKFKDHCLLFTTGKWREADGMFDVQWASEGFCIFPIVTGFLLIWVSIVQVVRYLKTKEEPSFLALFVDVVLGIWLLAFSIISALFITLGFLVWCDGITERFPSCQIAAGQNIIHGDTDKIDTSGFYMDMGTAQFGAWAAFTICVGVTIIALLRVIHNHQVRNIKVSMYLERQRLVNQHQADGRSTPPLQTIANAQAEDN